MKDLADKEKIKKILQKNLVELNDSDFTDSVIQQYIHKNERKEFILFWNNDLVYTIGFTIVVAVSSIFYLRTEFSRLPYIFNISIEDTILMTTTFFVFLIVRFLSEYLIKNTLP